MNKINSKELSLVRNSEYFDSKWYVEKYPDVLLSGIDPVLHYLKYGAKLLRDPSSVFSSVFYVEANSTCKKNNLNPLTHFLTRKTVWKPEPDKAVWALSMLSRSEDYGKMKGFLELYFSNDPARFIFYANFSLRNSERNSWLKNINDYLRSYDLCDIDYKEKEFLFDGFSTNECDVVNGGPLVTIIMAAWNSENTIRSSVNSILLQSWQNIELIIVDDASDDLTWEIINEIKESDSRVRVIRNQVNVGPYVSKNRAARIAKGKYITGHDADDWAHPKRIELQVKYLLEANEFACLSGMLRIDGMGEFVSFNKHNINTEDGITRTAFISLMVDSDFFRNILGYWDHVRFGGDSELINRIQSVIGKNIHRIHKPTMFCLDNPSGLTNHPVYGHSQSTGVSDVRKQYKQAFIDWHRAFKKKTSYLHGFSNQRNFKAPKEAMNESSSLSLISNSDESGSRLIDIKCTICIVTNLCFPGGNCSTTLEEIRYFKSKGYSVNLIHVPRDSNIDKPIAKKFYPYLSDITLWHDVDKIETELLIVRHPGTIVSSSFSALKNKIKSDKAYFVINNSMYRVDGDSVYNRELLSEIINSFDAKYKELCPISDYMRDELLPLFSDKDVNFTLSDRLWNPTFDIAAYKLEPKKEFKLPLRVGKHGRDGLEKWLEDKDSLLSVYPEKPDFEIKILGGANGANKIIGYIPKNWTVYEFGEIEPKTFFKNLDAFLYYPNSTLIEGFGRTIIEAVMAGIPCFLPHKFEQTFDALAFYFAPDELSENLVKILRNPLMTKYLIKAQEYVSKKYSSNTLCSRVGLLVDNSEDLDGLFEDIKNIRSKILLS